MKYSYKGLAMIVDNVRTYYGRFIKGMSRGSLWVGPVIEPLKMMNNNFWIILKIVLKNQVGISKIYKISNT
jgi:hypothetical protein